MAMIMIMMFIPVEQHDKLKDPWLLELFLVGLRRLGRDPEMFDNCASSWNYQIDHSIILMIMTIMMVCIDNHGFTLLQRSSSEQQAMLLGWK